MSSVKDSVTDVALVALGGPIGAGYVGYKYGGVSGALSGGLLGGLGAWNAYSNYQTMRQQNEQLRLKEAQEAENAKAEKAEKELELAQKQKEIQENLARTVGSQVNLLGATGQLSSPTGAALVNSSYAKSAKDENYVSDLGRYYQKTYDANAAYRQQSYAAARRANRWNMHSSNINSLIDFGVKAGKMAMGGF